MEQNLTNNQQTLSKVHINSDHVSIITVLVLGVALLVTSGHLQATTLHNAAHDSRHAMGFPCH